MLKRCYDRMLKMFFLNRAARGGRYTYIYSHSMTYMKNKRYD